MVGHCAICVYSKAGIVQLDVCKLQEVSITRKDMKGLSGRNVATKLCYRFVRRKLLVLIARGSICSGSYPLYLTPEGNTVTKI